ncbi:MAG: insulinase family protein [Candidatus Eisenbacteria bacterium]|nr:insulinase family protein [Candidatus Eisenbacteria bacterium]
MTRPMRSQRFGLLAIGFVLVLIAAIVLYVALTEPAEGQGVSYVPTVIPSENLPGVALRVLFETGSSDDPRGKEGLCALAARAVAHGGTPALTHSQVTDELYPYAATIDVQVAKDHTVFLATFHRETLDRVYPIFRDLLLQPRWDPADFERERSAALNAIRNRLLVGNDEELGKAALELSIYGDGMYGHPVRGTLRSLEGLTLEDAREFAAEHFVQARLRVGVAGAFPEDFVARLMTDLHALPAGEPRPPFPPAAEPIDGIEVFLVDKDAPAAAISMGFPVDFDRRMESYWPLYLFQHWFGEHRTFYGRLMNVMRVQRGLNYGDYAYIENFIQDHWTRLPRPNILRRGQMFSIWIRPVVPENAHFAVRQALRELELAVANGIPARDFETAKRHAGNYAKLRSQTLHRRLGNAMDDAILGIGDFNDRLEAALAEMTAEDVRQALQKHLTAENVKVAIVAPGAGELGEALAANEVSPITYATETAPAEILQEDEVIQSYPLDVTEVEIAPAKTLFRERGMPETRSSGEVGKD